MWNRKCLTRIALAFIIFIFPIVVMLLLQWANPEMMKAEVWIGVLGTCVAFYFGLLRQWLDHDKMFKELFSEFNMRFDALNGDLNEIVNQRKPNNKEESDVIQDYLNLCAEEYLWYKTGRIEKEVWEAWRLGMQYYIDKSYKIKLHFSKEKAYKGSYYGLFDQLDL
jgi:hypothetical protein